MAQYKLAHIDMKGNRGELHDLLKGMLYIDGEELPLKEGDCFRIDPQGERCLRAADDSAMRFICIQAKAGSLEGFTMSDAVVTESGSKPSWL